MLGRPFWDYVWLSWLRKSCSPEVKLLSVEALEEGLTAGEVSEIVGAGNSDGEERDPHGI
jgi:hypothetical protein